MGKIIREGKLYPNKSQEMILEDTLEKCRLLYNHCLELKINTYKDSKKNSHKFAIGKLVNDWDLPVNIRTKIINRMDNAFQRFFKAGGFPRFKAHGRYRSFALMKFKDDYRFKDGKLMLYKKYGFTPMRIRGLVPLTEPKEARVIKRASGWYFQVVDNIPAVSPKKVKKSVGVDLGLKNFIVDTKGNKVKAPKEFRKMENKLAIQQRMACKKRKGSNNRKKAFEIVAKTHERIKNKRLDFLHKLSRKYAEYDLVAIEKLNIKGMVRNHYLSKSINDASWGIFTSMLHYKLEMLGGHLVEVNPYNTTQKCSACGVIVHKTLSVRTHQCECGLILDRDENASRNILALGLDKAIAEGITIVSPAKQVALN